MQADTIFIFFSIALIMVFYFVLVKAANRVKNAPFIGYGLFSGVTLTTIYCLAAMYRVIYGMRNPILERFSLIPVNWVFYFIYLYFEAIISIRIPLRRFLLMTLFMAINTTLIFLDVLQLFAVENLFSLFATFSYLYGSIVAIFAIVVIHYTLRLANLLPLKIDLLAGVFVLFGTLTFQISGLISFFSQEAILWFWIGNCFYLTGLLMILINALKNVNYIYSIPNPISAILIYNTNGILIYGREFENYKMRALKKTDAVISGALTAFSEFFKTLMGEDANFKFIESTIYDFHFKRLSKEIGTLVVATAKSNYILRKSMENLVKEFSDFAIDSHQWTEGGYVSEIYEQFDKLVKKHFPYLIFEKNIKE
jgi:hypothetical protein